MKFSFFMYFHVYFHTFYFSVRNYREAAGLFNDKLVSPNYVRSIVLKFTTNFSVKDAPRSDVPYV